MDILDIETPPNFDETIEGIEFHSYNPYNESYNNNDEIRIAIQQQDLYILPSESSLLIEGTVNVLEKSKPLVGAVLINNAPAFLFQDIRYEMNGIEIDRIRNPGICSTIKSMISMGENDSNLPLNEGWSLNPIKILNNKFSFILPLKKLLGFAEDFQKIVINAKHELILTRSNTDLNFIIIEEAQEVDVKISRIQWRVPHIKVSDKQKLKLLKCLERDKRLLIPFRSWDLYEYPTLPLTNKLVWSVKTSSQLEKPRYVIVGFQTNRKNVKKGNCSEFDHCSLQNLKLYLNSQSYPYGNSTLANFEENCFSIIYEMYARFHQSYYNQRCQPVLSIADFKNKAPLFVIDCSRQNESLKLAPVDVRLEINTSVPFPTNTTAYCLIINDCLFEYKPLTNLVKKISS